MAVLDLRPPTGGAVHAKIDYLSFTIAGGVGEGSNNEFMFENVATRISQIVGDEAAAIFAEYSYFAAAGMGHYAHSGRVQNAGIALFYGGAANHILVQLSGTACAAFAQRNALLPLIERVHDRVTRIDVACDIDAPTLKVEDFTRYGYAKRFASGGTMHSPTGTTHYIGSRKSERFARVYRYAKPHPRAHLLRVEYELKGSYAKRAALALTTESVSALARTLGAAFGWKHPAWDEKLLDEPAVVTSRGEREGAGSVVWLMKQVLPAMVRLHQAGIFDVKAWLENTVLPALEE